MYAYEHVRCRVLVDECINRIGNFLFIWYFFFVCFHAALKIFIEFFSIFQIDFRFYPVFSFDLVLSVDFSIYGIFFPFCTKLGIQINLFRKWTNTMWGVAREWNFCEEFFIFSAVLARLCWLFSCFSEIFTFLLHEKIHRLSIFSSLFYIQSQCDESPWTKSNEK